MHITREREPATTAELSIVAPRIDDGRHLWRLARDSGGLDLNTSYAYLLFARDFSATSRIARLAGEPVGFVLGYLRPEAPDTLFVWQVATTPQARGRSVASRMLRDLLAATGATYVEATITAENVASHRLFRSLVTGHPGATVREEPLFATAHFPDSKPAENLVVVGPFDAAGGR